MTGEFLAFESWAGVFASTLGSLTSFKYFSPLSLTFWLIHSLNFLSDPKTLKASESSWILSLRVRFLFDLLRVESRLAVASFLDFGLLVPYSATAIASAMVVNYLSCASL